MKDSLFLQYSKVTQFYSYIHTHTHTHIYIEVLVTQLCLMPCDFMDCSPPGSSVYRILQARILDWIAISISRESS